MKTLVLIFGTIIFCFSIASCDDNSSNCDKQVIIDTNEYNTAPDAQVTINSVELNGDCLAINFGSSGCDGNSWEVELIDSEEVLDSNPLQRVLRLSLKNEEICAAYFTKELTFDISETQIDGDDILILNILNYEGQIVYEY